MHAGRRHDGYADGRTKTDFIEVPIRKCLYIVVRFGH